MSETTPNLTNRLVGPKSSVLALPLPARTVWAVALLVAAYYGWLFWHTEGLVSNIVFTCAISAAIASAITLATRRVLVATTITAILIAIIYLTAATKRKIMFSVVHAYDLVFYLSSWSTISYLWSDFRFYVLAFLGGLAALIIATLVAWRIDGTRVSRQSAAMAFVVASAVGAWGAQAKGERRHMQFFFENLYVSSFYASWSETIETLLRGQLIEAARHAHGPRLVVPDTCAPAERPPHIILIHQESVVQPSLFPTLGYDKSIDDFFKSDDGRLHRLRVETYGGASWLTEFSILAGLSTHSFGGMRQFVQAVMKGRIRDTLPEALKRCGYRNVVFYPMLRNFVSNDKFYKSVALNEIYDLKDQGAKRANERDRFYYANALRFMEGHMKERPGAPLFTFIQTMSAHWPYDVTYEPDEKVAGGGPGTDPEMHEYLRRVSLARKDYDWLLDELRRRFPNERFLIVHYGDHHPMSTRMLLGFSEDLEAEDVTLTPDSPGFITYFAVQGINYEPPALPEQETVDVPYLGAIIINSAGLPLSDAMRERKRLLEVCKGRYYGCARKDEILTFHRRLIDSRLMDAR